MKERRTVGVERNYYPTLTRRLDAWSHSTLGHVEADSAPMMRLINTLVDCGIVR